jgi:RimJ/RimL family protein N-acetyltransferase
MKQEACRTGNGGGEAAALQTARLVLRQWRESDLAPFARMNADPEVMRHFPSVLTREQSDALVRRIATHFEKHGFGPWAVEVRDSGAFAGFTGLSIPAFDAPFTPCVEIGWRLAREHWGQGYATEAARASLAYGFDALGLEEIVSFAVRENRASRRVMEKLGMTHDASEDFDHPELPEGHALRRHVLYRRGRP